MAGKRLTLILAPNYHQALHYMRDNELPQADARYVETVEHIMGLRDFDVVRVSGYQLHPNYAQIEEQIRLSSRIPENAHGG
jgi:FMN-dependent NADH-azoreductase